MIGIWSESAAVSARVAAVLGLHDPKKLLLLGNRNTSAARGRTLSVLLVLPGADPRHDAEVRPAVMSGAWVDLR